MNCDRCQEVLWEWILGPPEEVGEADRTAAEAHAAECPACREEERIMRRMRAAIPTPEEFAAAVPQETLDRIKKNVMDHISSLEAKKTPLRRKRGHVLRRQVNYLTWAAAAVLLAANLWVWHTPAASVPPQPEVATKVERPTPEQPQPPQVHTESPLRAAFDKLTTAPEAYAFLKERFETAKSDPRDGDFETLIALSQNLIARFPGTREELESRKLISRCHTQLAQHKRAREAFLDYVEALGECFRLKARVLGHVGNKAASISKEKISAICISEIDKLSRAQDFQNSVEFCEALIRRYPDSDIGDFARLTIARYQEAIKEPLAAIRAFEDLASSKRPTAWSRRASLELPRLYANSGQFDKAVQAYRDFIKRFPGSENEACAYCNMGMMLMSRGEQYYPGAIEAFQTVMERYPQETNYARMAEQRMHALNDRMIRSITIGQP